jgi:hypothetical protein
MKMKFGLVLGVMLVFIGCATDGGKTPEVNGGGGDELPSGGGNHDVIDGDNVIGGLVWKKEYFYSANPRISQDDHSLTLVFTETQLNFRYDSNGDGDFQDPGEYTYTYTITGFEGNDWRGGDNEEGNYERRITVNNEIKTGSGTNTDLTGRTEFWVSPNLGDNGKIDGKIWVYAGTEQNGKDLGFFENGGKI